MEDFIIKSKRDFPSVDILVSNKAINKASEGLPRPYVVEIVRDVVSRLKSRMEKDISRITSSELIDEILRSLKLAHLKKIDRVINGTGILVHTNLGRAPLSDELFENMKSHVTGYGNLEFDIVSGKRGQRGELAERYLALVSGAEAGTIVNNNAAALFLILNTFANRKKVLISRGELVQIGGGFRIPDIIRRAGAKLVEIGTTNITALDDYKKGLEENPAMILKVHRSNFSLTGFTDEVDMKTLVKLARSRDIPVVNDLGSGVLVDTTEFSGHREPTVQASVRDGAFLTCFSGDKLLGGVQAGLIVGLSDSVAKLKKNPIFRVLRVDKSIFSVIEELLGYYLDGIWKEKIKLWKLASRSENELSRFGKKILKEIKYPEKISLEKSSGEMGGGSLPEIQIPSMALVFISGDTPQKLAEKFRLSNPPIIGRIADGRFMIDLKAIDENDAPLLISIINKIIKKI